MHRYLVVFYREQYANNSLLITIDMGDRVNTMENVLDWYAEAYAVEREKIYGAWSNMVTYTPEGK